MPSTFRLTNADLRYRDQADIRAILSSGYHVKRLLDGMRTFRLPLPVKILLAPSH